MTIVRWQTTYFARTSNVEDSFDERIRAGAAIEPGEERFGIDRRFP